MAEFKYEIVDHVGVLSESGTGWSREINLIRWNDRDAKYDIRDWAPGKEKMSKGISLSLEEVKVLREILNSLEV